MEIHNIDVIVSKLLGPLETSPDHGEAENERRLTATSNMIDLAHSLVSQLRLMTAFTTSVDYHQRSQGEMAQEALRSLRLPNEGVPIEAGQTSVDDAAADFSAVGMQSVSISAASTVHRRQLDEYVKLVKMNVRNAAEAGLRQTTVLLPTTKHDWNAVTEKELVKKFKDYGFNVILTGNRGLTLTW